MNKEEFLNLPLEDKNKLIAIHVFGRNLSDFDEHQEHEWILDEDGEIDMWQLESGFHNGPACSRCGYSYCEHCHYNSDIHPLCVINPENYWNIPNIGLEIIKRFKKDYAFEINAYQEYNKVTIVHPTVNLREVNENLNHAVCLAMLRALKIIT